ncbi:hypothetical protein F4861DRAFT_551739 [Xylaria intraflava]|nr:hypothetical protein F4861DRAFT_551739 [Xylaria intraflava]
MARTIPTSRGSSPTVHLRPAPLCISPCKTAPIINGDSGNDGTASAVVTKDRDRTGDSTPTPPSPQKYSTPQFHSGATRSLPRRCGTGSKLEALLSRFEILDVVNTAGTNAPQYINSPYNKPRTDTILRDTISKHITRHDRKNHPQSSIKSISRSSSQIFPPRTGAPPAFGSRGRPGDLFDSIRPSVLGDRNMDTDEGQTPGPPGDHSQLTASSTSQRPGQDLGLVADRRKLFEGNKSYCPFTTSSIPTLRQSKSFRVPKSKSCPKNYPSVPLSSSASVTSIRAATAHTPNKVSCTQEASQKFSNDLMLPTQSNTTPPQQRLSVADLRRSFEKFSRPIAPPGGSTKTNLHSTSPQGGSMRRGHSMLLSTNSKRRSGWLTGQSSMPNGKSGSHTPLSDKDQISHVDSKPKETKQISPPPSARGLAKHGSIPSLPKSQSNPQQARKEKTEIPCRSTSWRSLSQIVDEHLSQEWENIVSLDISVDDLANGILSEEQMDAAFTGASTTQQKQHVKHESNGNPLGIPKVMSSGSRPTQVGGKVSQLRRIFERSSRSFSSSLSLLNLRSRPEQEASTEALTAHCSSPSWNESASPVSTHTIARRRSIVPSLTTDISVNDFFCDFVGDPDHEGSPVPTSPGGAAVGINAQTKPESPVKERIQQFEYLSRDSSNQGPPADGHDIIDDIERQYAPKANRKGQGKRKIVGGWRPIHLKGAAIWRRISGSFSRPPENWKERKSGGREFINSNKNQSPRATPDCSPSPKKGRGRVRRSSSFGYGLYRVSHTSRQFVSVSRISTSVQSNGSESLPDAPIAKSNTNYSHPSPDTPPAPLPVRKGFPIIARITSGLGRSRNFGLDGHVPSKPTQEELEPLTATPLGPSTPQGDPNALLKIMLKQSTVERGRRRQDEKHRHRDKKLRTLTVWKGKGSTAVFGPADSTITNERSKKHEKSKGKGKGIVQNASRRDERRTSGEGDNHVNKKTASGFAIFETKDIKLRHPEPRRPGQVRKLANMYRDKGSSGASLNNKADSGTTLKEGRQEGRQGLRQRASSALGLRSRMRHTG